VSDANAKGVLFVAAAGNDSNNNDLNPFYPASYPFGNIISVAATDQNDQRVSFSNFGYASVDVGAPGTYIISTVPTWLDNGFGYLEQDNGTSMAAPHVTGLAGLLYSYYYNFDSTQIRNMILSYVNLNPSLDGWVSSRGRINAARSMFALCEPFDLTLNQVSTFQINLSWTDIATEESNYLVERKEEGGAYVLVATLGQNTNAYTDNSNFKDGTKYYYRLRLKNWIGESPGVHENERSIITVLNPPTHGHSGGGGGCSIGATQNVPTSFADASVMFLPLLVIAVLRRRR
jgi:subtilisin family serine protease